MQGVQAAHSHADRPDAVATESGGQARKRVLALHGFAQTGAFFRQKTGSVRKGMKDVEFVYIDAPFSGTHPTIGEGKSWYEFHEKGEDGRNMEWGKFDETVKFLEGVFTQQGPFDGILGFSQGACVAGVLSAMLEHGRLPSGISFSFAVLISGFEPRDERYRDICSPQHKITKVRSLHVVGQADEVVDPSRSLQVADLFHNPTIVEHDKGHMVPSDKRVRDALKSFMLADVLH